jgi:hypothetical protein
VIAQTKTILLQHQLRTPGYNSIFGHLIQQNQNRNSRNLVTQVEFEYEFLADYTTTAAACTTAQGITEMPVYENETFLHSHPTSAKTVHSQKAFKLLVSTFFNLA